MKNKIITAMLMGMGLALSADAAVVSRFTFESLTLANSASQIGFSASSLGLNNGLLEDYTNGLGSNPWTPGIGYGHGQTNLGFGTGNAGSFDISGGAYVSFTVTPDVTNIMDFDTLSIDYYAHHLDRSADNFAVFANVGGGDDLTDALFVGFVGDTQDASVTSAGVTATDLGDLGTAVTANIDLTSSPVASVSSATEFRIYLFGVSVDSNNGSLTTIGDIELTGTVTNVIPEPSSLALLVLGGILVGLARRRPRTAA